MENVQGLVEKWEQSGLLEQVNSKENMALLLESSALKLLEVSSTEEYKDEFRAAGPLVFPIIQRSFRDRIYDTQIGAKPTEGFFVFVGTSELDSDEKEIKACEEASERVKKFLTEYENTSTTVTGIDIQLRKTGFFIGVHLL